jgi:hypothetical protein
VVEAAQGVGGVADQDAPERRARRFGGVGGGRPQFGALKQVVALDLLVVPEDGRAEGDDQVMAVKWLATPGIPAGRMPPKPG